MRFSKAILAALCAFSSHLFADVLVDGETYKEPQASMFYSADAGPASIGVNVSPRGHQVSLSYKGFLNECDPYGYLKPIQVHFIFHGARGTDIFVRKMSGECRTNSHPYASGHAQFQSFGSTAGFDVLWVALERVLGEDDASLRFELAFERDNVWDSAAGKNYPVEL